MAIITLKAFASQLMAKGYLEMFDLLSFGIL